MKIGAIGTAVAGLGMVLCLVSSLSLVTTSPADAAGAVNHAVRTSTKCKPKRYKNHYTAVTKDKRAVITHLHAFALPPSASHVVTKQAQEQTTLKARVKYDVKAELGASGAAKIIASASVSSHLSLQAAGSRTVTKSVKVKDSVSNPTRKNAQIVFFRGNLTAKGTFRYYYCSMYYTPTGNVGYFVYYKPGHWKSFTVYSDGGVRCGAGGVLNAVSRAALRQGC